MLIDFVKLLPKKFHQFTLSIMYEAIVFNHTVTSTDYNLLKFSSNPMHEYDDLVIVKNFFPITNMTSLQRNTNNVPLPLR